MIVKMKKIYLVILDSLKDKVLERLRELGVMHLELLEDTSEKTTELLEGLSRLKNAYNVLSKYSYSEVPEDKNIEIAFEISRKVEALKAKEKEYIEKIDTIKIEVEEQAPWGDFNMEQLNYIKGRGINIKLFEVKSDDVKKNFDSIDFFTINKNKELARLAAVILDNSDNIPFEEFPFPEKSLTQLNDELKETEKNLDDIYFEIKNLSKNSPLLNWAIKQIDEQVEFLKAGNSLERYGKISHLTGYLPVYTVDELKQVGTEEGWGIIISDPSENDPVPTIVKRPALVKSIKPVFELLGTLPGYKEFDISPWFLIFFCLFWSMIVGDAGYGLLFFIFTLIAKFIFRKAPNEIFALLFLTSFFTIIWGGMSGNWFGVESFSHSPLVSWMILPHIASFESISKGPTEKVIMHLCFVIGAVHLTIAHCLTFFRFLPTLKAFSEIGRISIIWGLYFLIRKLVIKVPMHHLTIWLIGAGFAMVIIFSEQKGNFLRGVGQGFANIIIISLGSVGFFSDIVSYVRLFAVGLATLEVAKSFNAMAAGMDTGVAGIIVGSLILFFGHGLNIVLCGMSLIVHGVRLNMLEFSGHLGMEWSGLPYKPFRKHEKKDEFDI